MAASARADIVDQVFDGLIERQATLFDLIRNGSDRYHRFNRSLIEGARQTNRDWAEVGRRWLSNPTDVIGVYEAVAEAVGSQRARTLALSREWIEDRVEAQRETSEMIRRSFGEVREAVQKAQEGAPEFLRRGAFGRRTNGSRETANAAE
jgi:hypothetical protein